MKTISLPTLGHRLVYAFVLFFLYVPLLGQSNGTVINLDMYKETQVKQDFETRFNTNDRKESFKYLREYLAEKENLLANLNNVATSYTMDMSAYIKLIDKRILWLKNAQKKLTKEGTITLTAYDIEIPGGYLLPQLRNEKDNLSFNRSYTSEELTDIITSFEDAKREFNAFKSIKECLQKNIEVVKQDIYLCRQQIDSTLAPEYKKQSFVTNISICFTVIIAILLIAFFLIVYLKSDASLSKDLLSGYGLQFITLFVLIIAVILFGILGILQSSELAAILSGISGYILGKGIQDKKPVNPTTTTPE